MMDFIYSLMDAILPIEALTFTFMKNAFLAILLLTPLLGLLGTMAVNQQMASPLLMIGDMIWAAIAPPMPLADITMPVYRPTS